MQSIRYGCYRGAVRAVAIDSIGPICPRIIGLGWLMGMLYSKPRCSDLDLIFK